MACFLKTLPSPSHFYPIKLYFFAPFRSEPAVTGSDNAPKNSIVVTAQRSGAPMWTIDTPVILAGEMRAIPKTTPWQPDRRYILDRNM